MAQHGYQHATVSDICRAAGVTRPVFYELFSGKEDAFLAAHRHGTGVVMRRMAAAFAAAPDWCTGIREALRALLGLLAGVPAFATMAVIEVEAVGPAGRREIAQLLTRFRAFFAEVPEPPGVSRRMRWWTRWSEASTAPSIVRSTPALLPNYPTCCRC